MAPRRRQSARIAALDWLPYNVREAAGTLIDWCAAPDRTLREPFFDQTIGRLIREEGAETRTTPAAALAESRPGDGGRFGGLIFHGSRCGSTLVAQMLAAVPRFTVISEPLMLNAAPDLRDDMLAAMLRWATDGGRTAFVKFSARAIVDPRPLPAGPALFLYRDPLEVVVACAGAGDRLPPGVGGLLDGPVEGMRPAEFWSRVVGRQYAAAAAREGLTFVNYERLLGDAAVSVRDALDLDLSAAELQAMRGVTSRHAKAPSKPFADDRDAKRAAATREIRKAVLRWAREPYEQLARREAAITCLLRPDSAGSTRDTPSSAPRSSGCR